MSEQKAEGRAIRIGTEVFIVTRDKAVPRHYQVAGYILLATLIPKLLDGGPLGPLFYSAFVGVGGLFLAWLFDDRDTYRLRKVMEVGMPAAAPEPSPDASGAGDS